MLRFISILLLSLLPVSAIADSLKLHLKWLPQAQFAGYYVAEDKGFYAKQNLEISFVPGGPEIDALISLGRTEVDLAIGWMPDALYLREEDNSPIVNIAQPFSKMGMQLSCARYTGIEYPEQMAGKTLAVWRFSSIGPFLALMQKLGLVTDAGNKVSIIQQLSGVQLLWDRTAACISTMTYNEYLELLDRGLRPSDLTVFDYDELGVFTLEDGLYAHEMSLYDDAKVAAMTRFVSASMEGWRYAMANPDEAAAIIAKYSGKAVSLERRSLEAIRSLLTTGNGALDPADYRRTVDTLLVSRRAGITREPEGAWTSVVTDLLD